MNNNKAVSKSKWHIPVMILLGINICLVLWRGMDGVGVSQFNFSPKIDYDSSEKEPSPLITVGTGPTLQTQEVPTSKALVHNFEISSNDGCNDPNWCNVAMSSVSHFKFLPPPTDPERWRRAQIQAANGEQVILREVIKQFPNKHDFLNGDRSFRPIQPLVDVFINDVSFYKQITKDGHKIFSDAEILRENKHVGDIMEARWPRKKGENPYEVMLNNVPFQSNWRAENRAPFVELGYPTFNKVNGKYFTGTFSGGMYLNQPKLFEEWNAVKHRIDTPFIGLSVLNENWGFLSTVFPGRVANWSICRCEKFPRTAQLLKDFLDDENTLMLVVSQHHNQSHPKILTLPRGMPLEWDNTEQLIFDAMGYSVQNIKRKHLLFAAASSWGPRPRILRCVSDRIPQEFFEGHADAPKPAYEDARKRTQASRAEYYHKLGRSMFGLAMPGLGYDCFRTWELLTMGSIVVIERSIGYDRTFWKLPVLLLDDFSVLNEQLLREAYLQALYHHKEFEFERLKQSYWENIIKTVSRTRSSKELFEKFPMEAEDRGFRRPFVRYECAKTNTCGEGTFRIPEESC